MLTFEVPETHPGGGDIQWAVEKADQELKNRLSLCPWRRCAHTTHWYECVLSHGYLPLKGQC